MNDIEKSVVETAGVSLEELAIMEQEMLLLQSSSSESSDDDFELSDSSDEYDKPWHPRPAAECAAIKRQKRRIQKIFERAKKLERANKFKAIRLNDAQRSLMEYNKKLNKKNAALNARAVLLKAKEEELAIRESLLEQVEKQK